ncbi:MAG: phosphatase PAP2 family protein [bacterium]|nr:phosphatase PAP2 family protein [bacterium]
MIQYLTGLDGQVLQYLFAHRDIATSLSFIGITELGSTIFVCGLTLCLGIYFLFRRQVHLAAGLAVAVFGSGAAALLIKELVHRARPVRAFQAYAETGFSFPSGHATLAAAFYGFLIYLAWRMMPPGFARTATVCALSLLIVVVAFSRLYLGVHFLSDVAGGLILGGIFVWIGSVVVKKIKR